MTASPSLRPPVAIFVPQESVTDVLNFAKREEIDIAKDTFQTKEELSGRHIAESTKGTIDSDEDRGHNASNPLTDLFAQKIQSAFNLGHETFKSVLESSFKVATIFAAARAIKAIQPLASIAASKLPGYITRLTPAIPGTDMLKFLGLFFIVKAALQPLIEKILETPANDPMQIVVKGPLITPHRSQEVRQQQQEIESSDEESEEGVRPVQQGRQKQHNPNQSSFSSSSSGTVRQEEQYPQESSYSRPSRKIRPNNFKKNAICFLTPLLLTFLVRKQVGLDMNSVSKVLSVALGYPLVQRIEKVVTKLFTKAYNKYHNSSVKDPISHFLFKYLPK